MQLTLAELKAAEDLDLGTSASLRVDQDKIDGFATATEDRQWIHVDPERAAASAFGGTIAHGFLTLSLIPRLLFEMVSFPDAEMVVNQGVDKVRFMSPVPAGSEVFLKARLVSAVEQRTDAILFRVRVDVLLAETRRRALVAEVLFVARPAAAPPAEALPTAASPTEASP